MGNWGFTFFEMNWGFTFDLSSWGWGRASGRRASTGVWPSRGGPAPATLQQPAGGRRTRRPARRAGGRRLVAIRERIRRAAGGGRWRAASGAAGRSPGWASGRDATPRRGSRGWRRGGGDASRRSRGCAGRFRMAGWALVGRISGMPGHIWPTHWVRPCSHAELSCRGGRGDGGSRGSVRTQPMFSSKKFSKFPGTSNF